MKRIFTFILALSISMSSIYANNESNNDDKETPKYSFNQKEDEGGWWQSGWFASAGAGALIYFGDHDKQLATGKRISPGFELSAGKWINEVIGVRLNFNAGKMKGLTQFGKTNGLSTGKLFRAYDNLWHQEFNYINGNADFMFNWTNDIDETNVNNMYHLIPYAGIGFISATNKQKGTSFAVNVGVLNTFKVSEKWGIYADVRGAMFRDKVDGEVGGRNFDGLLTVLIGASYSF